MWPFKRKPEPLTLTAKVGMIAQDVLVNPSDDEQLKADKFRMETIAAYIRQKEEAGVEIVKHKLDFLISEMEYLAAKLRFKSAEKVHREALDGNHNPT